MTDQPPTAESSSRPAPKRKLKRILLILLALILIPLIGIQLVPVSRANPPVTVEIVAPAEVMSVLRESCYDCHSNQTRWPWYAYIAPVSWFVANHVEHGRSEMNFTEWDQYDADTKQFLIDSIWHEVEEGHMPLESYLKLHGDARLTPEDRAALEAWSAGATASAPVESQDDDEADDGGRGDP